jgi:putative two-component system response regulator
MDRDILKRSKILIVDDEEANHTVLAKILEARGFRWIHSETDPRRALQLFPDYDPDLVLLDLRMPQMDGLSLMKQLRSRVAEGTYLPFVIISEDLSDRARREALSLGARDFLPKPFDPGETVLRLYNLLETRWLHLKMDQKVRERTKELEEAQIETLRRLALAADYKDDLTGLHAQRVGFLAALLAETVGLSLTQVSLIREAAPLHDLGKIGIPDHILLRPGPLTVEEQETVKTHTLIGARILSGSRLPLLQMAEEIAKYHHERWDGRGYMSLRREDIPRVARITTLADTFDVLTHDRPHKSAQTVAEALTEIRRERGHQFDPELVDALLDLSQNHDLGHLEKLLETTEHPTDSAELVAQGQAS